VDAPNFFSEGSPYLGHPLLTAERSAREVDELLVGETPRRVLDVGCGFGRHTVEFARRGLAVTAVDPSPTMCAEARDRLATAGLDADVRCGTVRDLVVEGSVGEGFDLVVSLFTSFGQVGADERDPATQLGDIANVVAPGGRLVIELFDRDRVVAGLVDREQLGPTLVERSWDSDANHLTETFDTPTGAFRLVVRLFGRDELVDLVRGAGFAVDQMLDRGLVSPPHTMMTIFARRPDR